MIDAVTFSPEIAATFLLAVLALALFISDRFPTDVNALIILVSLGLVGQLPFLTPLLPDNLLFSGFASSAVVSIIALMIMAAGIEQTGGMDVVAKTILRYSGANPLKLVALFCLMAGTMSGFVQNIGVVALCLPVASYLSLHSGIPLHRLLMPMGFCVILGGNLTMIGNGSLIILNDLIASSNLLQTRAETTPEIGLFDVTPVGIALLGTGILLFSVFNTALFSRKAGNDAEGEDNNALLERFGLEELAVTIPQDHVLTGQSIAELEDVYECQVLAFNSAGRPNQLAPFRTTIIDPNTQLGLVGSAKAVQHFLEQTQLNAAPYRSVFGELAHRQGAGYSEAVVSSRSSLIDKSLSELYFRKYHAAAPVSIQRRDAMIGGGSVNHTKLVPGDMILLYSAGSALKKLNDKKALILVNSQCAQLEKKHDKAGRAAGFFIGSILLALLTRLPLELCLWAGVLGMFLNGIVQPAEAYRAVSWKTVILLAGLIPLGLAIDHTGAASWLGQRLLAENALHPIALQFILALVTTLLTLIMSNVGATILLVPIALSIAVHLDQSPLFWALLVGITSSNSFLIPTHQANALILSAGRYQVSEFVRIGGGVTLLYIIIELFILNLVFLP